MSQANRYMELAALAGRKKLDSSYYAAFYLLSCNAGITKAAAPHVSMEGIDFAGIKRAVRNFEEVDRQMVDIAHNLFSWNSKCKVSPFYISRMRYPYMEQVCNALYIAADEFEVVISNNEQTPEAEIKLNADQYQSTIHIHSCLDQMFEESAGEIGKEYLMSKEPTENSEEDYEQEEFSER